MSKIRLIIIFFSLYILNIYALTNTGLIYKNIFSDKSEYTHYISPFIQLKKNIKFKENKILLNYSYTDSQKKINTFIYPLYYNKKTKNSEESSITFLFKKTKLFDGNEVDEDNNILSLIYYGNDTYEKKYFAFVPFYGTLKGKLGKTKIKFIMLPFYLYTEDNKEKKWNYLYPFIGYGEFKNGKKNLTKVFPFYSKYKYNIGSKKYLQKSYMWPFYKKVKLTYKTKKYLSYYIFPFYAEENKPNGKFKSFLYPLIKYKVNNIDEYFSVFPFYEHRVYKNFSYHKYFPFYSQTKRNNKKNGFFLFPLGWYNIDKNKNLSEYYFLPIIKKRKNNNFNRFQLWPLFKYTKNYKTKNINFSFLSFDLFLKDTILEKNYSRFWRILKYNKINKNWNLNLLFSTIELNKNKNLFNFNFNPIFKLQFGKERKYNCKIFFDLIKL